jgi:hypothetical protein
MIATEPWSYYWDYDRDRLVTDETIWVEWLEHRFDLHIKFGLRNILHDLARERGWALIFAHTVFGAVEGLSSFAYSSGSDGDKFKQFCCDYVLPKPCPWPGLAEAMYHNFRCGLAHGFGIEKGGLTFKEDVPSEDPVTVDGDSFWIDPRWLYERLEQASEEFFRQAKILGSGAEANLRDRFRWFLGRTSMQPPRKRI